jgi:DNA-binding beta-propeller fold protein YncE
MNAWGTEGGAEDQFRNPTGIALDESNGWVYVVDAGNNRVQKFDSRGNFLKVWGTSDIGDGQFQAPGAITVDESGSVYVADTGLTGSKSSTAGAATWDSRSPESRTIDNLRIVSAVPGGHLVLLRVIGTVSHHSCTSAAIL